MALETPLLACVPRCFDDAHLPNNESPTHNHILSPLATLAADFGADGGTALLYLFTAFILASRP